jgi:hypothetical protein
MRYKILIYLTALTLFLTGMGNSYAQTTPTSPVTATPPTGEYLLAFEVTLRVAEIAPANVKTLVQTTAPKLKLAFKVEDKAVPSQTVEPVIPTTTLAAGIGKDYLTYRLLVKVEGTARSGTLLLLDNTEAIYATKPSGWSFTPGNYTMKGVFLYVSLEQVGMATESIETRNGLATWAEPLAQVVKVSSVTPPTVTTKASRGNPLLFLFLTVLFLTLGGLILVHGFQVGVFKPKSQATQVAAVEPSDRAMIHIPLSEQAVASSLGQEETDPFVPLLGDLDQTNPPLSYAADGSSDEDFGFNVQSQPSLFSADVAVANNPLTQTVQTALPPTLTFPADGEGAKIQFAKRQKGKNTVISQMGLLGSGLEASAFELLKENAALWLNCDRVDVNKQVSLLSLANSNGLNLNGRSYSSAESSYMNNGSSLDFVLEAHKEGKPIRLIALEMDGIWHDLNQKQIQRDKRKDSILAKINIDLIRAKKADDLEKALKKLAVRIWK